MIARLVKGLGALVLLTAGAAFITAVSLLVFGSYLATWPLMRLSPREQRTRATVELAAAALTAITAFADKRPPRE